MFGIYKLWKKHGFEILIAASLLCILILGIYSKIYNNKLNLGSFDNFTTAFIKNNSQNINLQKPKYYENSFKTKRDSTGEIECRRVLQKIFNRRFDKARPDFLRNPVTGNNFNLELDCFDKELGLAVEYNGKQHYEFIPYFHKNKEAFMNQKYRDDMKRRICKENGIYLIEVPYTIKVENIENYLKRKLNI